jgi:plasmid maintenance system antidote protein VapI
MMSFQITLSPSRRTAARFVTFVRRTIQQALVEENKRTGLNQTEIARKLGVHRSVISREINGYKDITIGRVAELAWAMGRRVEFSLPHASISAMTSSFNIQYVPNTIIATTSVSAGTTTATGNAIFNFNPGSAQPIQPLQTRAA